MATVATVTNRGLETVTDRLKGVGGAEPKYVGWGTGATAAAAEDTGLETAAAESRASGTSTQETTNTAKDTYQVVATLTCAGGSKNITEVALFDASTSGNCFARATFDPVGLDVGDSIAFTIKTVFDQA